MSKLDEIKQALEAATPGPWEWQEDRWHGGYSGISNNEDKPVLYPSHANEGDWGAAWFDDDGLTKANAHLIANAPTWLAELVKVAEAAQAWKRAVTFPQQEHWRLELRKTLEAFK